MNAIICDLDGTLALLHGRNPYDASTCEKDLVNQAIAEIVRRYYTDHVILLVSGRSDLYWQQTTNWLVNNNIPYHHLYMRKDGDYTPDEELKQQIYQSLIQPNHEVEFVLDDRSKVVNMWRANKLICLQVGYGDF